MGWITKNNGMGGLGGTVGLANCKAGVRAGANVMRSDCNNMPSGPEKGSCFENVSNWESNGNKYCQEKHGITGGGRNSNNFDPYQTAKMPTQYGVSVSEDCSQYQDEDLRNCLNNGGHLTRPSNQVVNLPMRLSPLQQRAAMFGLAGIFDDVDLYSMTQTDALSFVKSNASAWTQLVNGSDDYKKATYVSAISAGKTRVEASQISGFTPSFSVTSIINYAKENYLVIGGATLLAVGAIAVIKRM